MNFTENFLENVGVVDFAYTEESKALSFKKFSEWIAKHEHGPLSYLADERGDKREDLKFFWPEFQSALVFLFSYKETKKKLLEKSDQKLHIASYTLGFEGLDYHYVLKEKLNVIYKEVEKNYPGINFKISLDVHPVLERDLAVRSGLGWIGKNSMLINQKEGSYFIIASILFNQKLNISLKKIEVDHCGQCTRCIDACPTRAIDESLRTIRAQDCISTFTIEEMKLSSIASSKMDLSSGNIFGCDICQDVCPWNNKLLKGIKLFAHSNFNEKQNMILDFFNKNITKELIHDLEQVSDRQFRKKFQFTSFERGGKNGILKNLYFYLQNKVKLS